MSKILKQDQTVTGDMRVNVYRQPAMGAEEGTGQGIGEDSGAGQDAAARRYVLISEEKRKILDHARRQAEQSAASILEDAYDHRDKIVNTAHAEAERIRERSFREGYEDGLRQAAGDLSRSLDAIQGAVSEAAARLEEYEKHMGDQVTEAALMIAEKILRKKIESDEAEITDMVQAAVLSERDKTSITVHVSDRSLQLVEQLEQRLEPLRERIGTGLRIKTENQPPGFVRVETEEGIVDASLDVQLDNLKRQLTALEIHSS